METIGAIATDTLRLMAVIVVPLAVFGWAIHQLEYLIQKRLSSRFGWNSVLLTGWLGTPIHELSHALMCVIFRHRIVEMALFRPDPQNRRLGYVIHSWRRGDLYQDIGGFFIGIAPMIGGTLALMGLLLVFFPDEGQAALFMPDSGLPFWRQVLASVGGLFQGLFRPENLATFRLWLFLYLVICVGAHMAPSADDYRGALKGAILAGGILLAICLLLSITGTEAVEGLTHRIAQPVAAVLIATTMLCGIATAAVYLATGLADVLRRTGSQAGQQHYGP